MTVWKFWRPHCVIGQTSTFKKQVTSCGMGSTGSQDLKKTTLFGNIDNTNILKKWKPCWRHSLAYGVSKSGQAHVGRFPWLKQEIHRCCSIICTNAISQLLLSGRAQIRAAESCQHKSKKTDWEVKGGGDECNVIPRKIIETLCEIAESGTTKLIRSHLLFHETAVIFCKDENEWNQDRERVRWLEQ